MHTRSAPLETAWSVLADQVSMAAWAPARRVMLQHEGDPPPNGVGAIRVFSQPPLKVREQVTSVEAPVRLAYRLLSGDIIWKVTLTPRFPGMTLVVRRVIRALAHGLAAESQRVAAQEGRTQ